MRHTLERWLDSPRVTLLTPLVTLAIGLFFVFVWAPHPWGWRGIDQYDALAKELALGQPFSTTDVPWGYTYYLAIFYKFFGEHTWAPVTGQVFINALTPLLLFILARPAVGHRIAALAAWITAIFSFNTVYASTQSSDAICTVLFLLSLLCFVRGHTRSSVVAFAAAGALAGVVPQFRPNMILLPIIVIAGYVFFPPRGIRRVLQCAVFMIAMCAVLTPWIVRNYRYTGAILPTSTHGGIQLWYGTLQTGPYLESRAHNPRSAFASPAFPYTSLEAPIVVSAEPGCDLRGPIRLTYKTSRDDTWHRVDAVQTMGIRSQFEIPAQPLPTTVYYFFEVDGRTMPPGGATAPFIYFISADHLGDMDTKNEWLDIFDIGRLARHISLREPLPAGEDLDINRDGRVDAADLSRAIAMLLPQWPDNRDPLVGVLVDGANAVVKLADGSQLIVPPSVQRQTDLEPDGELTLAGVLVSRARLMTSLDTRAECAVVDEVKVNDVFYRREPHEMARYTALAFDNIGRDPAAFLAASAYRMVRLFIIRGTDDVQTTHQFPLSHAIFQAGMVASLIYFGAFVFGIVIAWRARSPFLYALIPIVYVPLTICFVLTNMRYTITVQPLMFVFVAMTVAALTGLGGPRTAASRT
jgi:hypothetical protein